jgi:NAD(P)-dependent dehydrogenase (short-subunit alcohol dehydrogenase family)
MPSAFTGKRIVVTGGAGGIGIETVRAFMEQGGHVIMADIDEAALERAQSVPSPRPWIRQRNVFG